MRHDESFSGTKIGRCLRKDSGLEASVGLKNAASAIMHAEN